MYSDQASCGWDRWRQTMVELWNNRPVKTIRRGKTTSPTLRWTAAKHNTLSMSYCVQNKQELSCRRQKASRLCKIVRYRQHCYGTVRSIIYNTDSKSSGYYSTVESTFKSSVTRKTQPTYELINQFLETRSCCITQTITLTQTPLTRHQPF